jgi:serine protease Do
LKTARNSLPPRWFGDAANPDDADAPVKTAAVLGMTSANSTTRPARNLAWLKDVSGVIVTEVAPNSPADEKGVVAGDVITEIAGIVGVVAEDVLNRVDALKGQGRKSALLMLASKTGDLRFVPVPID